MGPQSAFNTYYIPITSPVSPSETHLAVNSSDPGNRYRYIVGAHD